MDDIIGKNYYDNVEHDFRPDGADGERTRGTSRRTPACNKCHNPLSAHGGSRQDAQALRPLPPAADDDPDTGNTVDFKVMVHKIHRGSEPRRASRPGPRTYIIGNSQSVHDFSNVVFPQDIRNCVRCHAPEATQSNVWYTFPSRAACASCHDNIDWVTGANHPAGPQADDTQCAQLPPAGRRP